MNIEPLALARTRFAATLEIVFKEGQHLNYSIQQVRCQPISPEWAKSLGDHPDLAVQVEAFVSRFGRMQDTIGDKLLPRWLLVLGEKPGSFIDNLNRAEQLGVVVDTAGWLEMRQRRNLLIHEYVRDPAQFAEALQMSLASSQILTDTYNRLREYGHSRLGFGVQALPPALLK